MKRELTRREMLCRCSTGFGLLALSGLMSQKAFGALRQPAPDIVPRARNVIFCYMSGGVSHLDSFDPKPLLKKLAGQPMPVKVERTMFNDNVQMGFFDVYDQYILNILYDPRITAGMTIPEVNAVLPQVLADVRVWVAKVNGLAE